MNELYGGIIDKLSKKEAIQALHTDMIQRISNRRFYFLTGAGLKSFSKIYLSQFTRLTA